ncbi:MAG TPA: TonB-dependent receptor, partial [Bacteroidales bacterium]|nr:TonB-dependent receptor [Bacteroidales bacterium]
MFRKLFLLCVVVIACTAAVYSQTGTIQGRIIDKETREPIPFANIIAEIGGTMVSGSTTSFEGEYSIKPLDPGVYTVKVTYIGYEPLAIQGVLVIANQIRFLNIELTPTTVALPEFTVVEFAIPLIDPDRTASGATITAEEIARMPNRTVNAIATTVGGVFSADGERGSVRGQRAEGTVMFIDGIRVRGSSALPESAIEQVSVILGGVPAQFGDAVGGIINVTTRGPSRVFGAGFELESSQFLDAFGYNRLGVNMQGPILMGRDGQTALLGYFVAGDFIYREDSRPTALGVYKVKDEVLAYLEQNPIRPAPTGVGSFYNSNFIRMSDLEHVSSTQNTNAFDINLSGKIDVRTGPNVNLSFGGSYNTVDRMNFSFANSLFNYRNNAQILQNTWRVFGRFTHRFPNDPDRHSFVRNVFYSLQADYSMFSNSTQDPNHQQNFFEYGFLGSFTTHTIRSYAMGMDEATGLTAMLHTGFMDTLFTFQPAGFNPLLANYTQQYYDIRNGQIRRFEDLSPLQGGLVNSQAPISVYGLFANPGAVQTGFNQYESRQIGVNAHF